MASKQPFLQPSRMHYLEKKRGIKTCWKEMTKVVFWERVLWSQGVRDKSLDLVVETKERWRQTASEEPDFGPRRRPCLCDKLTLWE